MFDYVVVSNKILDKYLDATKQEKDKIFKHIKNHENEDEWKKKPRKDNK